MKSKKCPRRGLKKAVENVLKKGLAPPCFGVDEIKKGLTAEGWIYDVDYNMNSMVHAIKDHLGGCVEWKNNVRNNADKVWSYKPAQASSVVGCPSHETIARMVDEIAEEIIPIIRNKIEEKFKQGE